MKWAIVKQKQIGLYLCEQSLGKSVMGCHTEQCRSAGMHEQSQHVAQQGSLQVIAHGN